MVCLMDLFEDDDESEFQPDWLVYTCHAIIRIRLECGGNGVVFDGHV